MKREIILTEDGSHTVFVPEMGEHYHSVHGAIQESRHIFINHGFLKVPSQEISILEVGFGTGLNALLTLLQSISDNKLVRYETWEAFPLLEEESGLLNYAAFLHAEPEILNTLHRVEWESEVAINQHFKIMKIQDDIRTFHSDRIFDLVYFDAFGPDYQPDLWSAEVFGKISACMKQNSRLVTYSAKGQVRRNLKQAGFAIEKAPGPPGKREITIAIKI